MGENLFVSTDTGVPENSHCGSEMVRIRIRTGLSYVPIAGWTIELYFIK